MSRYASRFVRRVVEPKNYNLLPPATEAKEGLLVLMEYLVGDIQIAAPVSSEQAITVIVNEILLKHSRQYRKDVRAANIRRVTKRVRQIQLDMEYFTEG